MTGFDGKVAIVTGGGRGFGRRFAQAVTGEGAAVVIADVDAAAATATVAELRASGANALALECDVAREADVDRAVAATIDEFGRLDVVLNNAGRHLTKYNQPFGA